jgi:hypothetical protein
MFAGSRFHFDERRSMAEAVPIDDRFIARYITDSFPGVDAVLGEEAGGPAIAAGDTFFFYNPDRGLEPVRRFPFATIVTKDYGDFDRASMLNRPGVFRLNIGVKSETYRSLFGPQPPATPGGQAIDTGRDFSVLDQLLPHPLYASMSWVCVLNPSAATLQAVQPLLAEAYNLAVGRHARREARGQD